MSGVQKSQSPVDDIVRDFCNGMKNAAKEQVRLTGEIARSLKVKGTIPTRSSDTLSDTISSFCQIEHNLENIENNLNKVSALTRNQS